CHWLPSCFEKQPHLVTEYVPAFEPMAVDPVGAGDVFLAGVALADITDAPPQHGIYLGSALAALHVLRLGNSPVESPALHRYIDSRPELAR
ncbi:MAG: PfkB family carbohydrate kinase, partial [Myxococcota bacterium]